MVGSGQGDDQPKAKRASHIPLAAEESSDDEQGNEEAGGGGAGGNRPRAKAKAATDPGPAHPRLLATLKGFTDGVTSAVLSADGQLAAAVGTDRTMRIYSGLLDAEPGAKLPLPLMAQIRLDHGAACSLSSNGRNVIVGTAQGKKLLAVREAAAALFTSRRPAPPHLLRQAVCYSSRW